jgi:hypothetical protein
MDAEHLGALVVSKRSADGQHPRPNATEITARRSRDTARLPCLELVDLGGILADAGRHSSVGLAQRPASAVRRPSGAFRCRSTRTQTTLAMLEVPRAGARVLPLVTSRKSARAGVNGIRRPQLRPWEGTAPLPPQPT